MWCECNLSVKLTNCAGYGLWLMSDVCDQVCCWFVDIFWLHGISSCSNLYFFFFEGEGAVEIQTDIWFRRRIPRWERRCRAVPSTRVLGKPLKKQTDFLLAAPLLPDGSSYPDHISLLSLMSGWVLRNEVRFFFFFIPVVLTFFFLFVVFAPFCMKL